MPEFSQIIRSVSPEKFSEIFGASTRQARETYFHRHGIRKPKSSNKIKSLAGKNEARTLNLFEALKSNDDDEMAEEVLRTWLLTKREMLAVALDYLEVDHDNGLSESEDLDDIFGGLKGKKLDGLISSLSKQYDEADVKVYLRFMGVEAIP